jgi:hypothetical protein
MRRGIPVVGAIATGAAVVVLGLAGCGGSSAPIVPGPGALREALKQTIGSELAKQGASNAQVACVDRNIEEMPERRIAERIVDNDPSPQGQHEPEKDKLGSIGKGCF